MDLGWGDAYDSYRSSKGFLQEVYYMQLHIPCQLRSLFWDFVLSGFGFLGSFLLQEVDQMLSTVLFYQNWWWCCHGVACDRKWISKWQRCLFESHVPECAPGSAGDCSLPPWNSLPSILQLGTKGATFKGERVPQPPNWLNLCHPMLFVSMLINANYGSGACDALIIKAILFFCACTVCHKQSPDLGSLDATNNNTICYNNEYVIHGVRLPTQSMGLGSITW